MCMLLQSEYLDACNDEEMVRSELQGLRRQREQVATEVQTMHSAAQRLENIYAEQDQLLSVHIAEFICFHLKYAWPSSSSSFV